MIRSICKRHKIRIIVLGSEAELLVLLKHAKGLEDDGFLVVANEPLDRGVPEQMGNASHV